MRRRAFTLIELLVVIAIVLLSSLVALSAFTNLNGRQITDAARIFSGGLVGARDSAIKYNRPRGIRLMPDPVLTIPALGSANAGTAQLCYNRYIPIEPAADYSDGKVNVSPQYWSGGTKNPGTFPPLYSLPDTTTFRYPFVESPGVSNVLMIEESPYAGGFTSTGQPNSPTNWYWNIRVGDKIKLGGSGRSYTIVGPCVVNPNGIAANGTLGNPEMFVNVGPPGTVSPLARWYYPIPGPTSTALNLKPFSGQGAPEFLFLVNGEDDDLDGYIDNGADGYNNNASFPVNALIDEPLEWEVEKWTGTLAADAMQDKPTNPTGGFSPSPDWIFAHYAKSPQDESYLITRRPVPTQGAREVMLPTGLVIDATTWNSTQERSRIPVTPGSLYCDIMVNPTGLYIPTTQYSSVTSASTTPFLHFWICDRGEVYPVGTLPTTASSLLPMPTSAMITDASGNAVLPTSDGQYYPGALTGVPVLKGERRLVTMFAQSGLVTTNTIESIPPLPPEPPITVTHQVGEGFLVGNVNYPFLRAQQGQREAR